MPESSDDIEQMSTEELEKATAPEETLTPRVEFPVVGEPEQIKLPQAVVDTIKWFCERPLVEPGSQTGQPVVVPGTVDEPPFSPRGNIAPVLTSDDPQFTTADKSAEDQITYARGLTPHVAQIDESPFQPYPSEGTTVNQPEQLTQPEEVEAALAQEAVQAAEEVAAKVFENNEFPAAVNEYLDSLQGSDKFEVIHLFERLREYVKGMDLKNVQNAQTGAAHQHTLFSAIMQLFERVDSQDFRTAFTYVRQVFAHHQKTIFSSDAAMRFVANMDLEASEKDSFTRLLILLMRTTGSDYALAVKSLNLGRCIAGLSEEAQMRVISYFKN